MSTLQMKFDAIFIGTSAGGVSAILSLLKAISAKPGTPLQTPIIVVQHLPATAEIDLALVFSGITGYKVLEATDKLPLLARHIYFAPPNYHLLIERDRTLALSQDEPVSFSRPSIDVLFESAAVGLGSKACGVILTGANSDGSLGLKAIKEAGGYTIVQDPNEAEVSMMPSSAINLVSPDFIGTREAIAGKLFEFEGVYG